MKFNIDGMDVTREVVFKEGQLPHVDIKIKETGESLIDRLHIDDVNKILFCMETIIQDGPTAVHSPPWWVKKGWLDETHDSGVEL